MHRLLVATALGAVALLAGGTAWAVIPDSDGTFHGCVNQATGLLRIVDPDKRGSLGQCIDSGPTVLRETPVDWNRVGPPGPQGPPAAGSDLFVRFGGGVNLDETDYRLGMELPAGAYEVTATFQLENDKPDQSFINQPLVTCRVGRDSGTPSAELRQSLPPARGIETVTAGYAFEVDEPWTLELHCPRLAPGTGLVHMSRATLRARAVEQLIVR